MFKKDPASKDERSKDHIAAPSEVPPEDEKTGSGCKSQIESKKGLSKDKSSVCKSVTTQTQETISSDDASGILSPEHETVSISEDVLDPSSDSPSMIINIPSSSTGPTSTDDTASSSVTGCRGHIDSNSDEWNVQKMKLRMGDSSEASTPHPKLSPKTGFFEKLLLRVKGASPKKMSEASCAAQSPAKSSDSTAATKFQAMKQNIKTVGTSLICNIENVFKKRNESAIESEVEDSRRDSVSSSGFAADISGGESVFSTPTRSRQFLKSKAQTPEKVEKECQTDCTSSKLASRSETVSKCSGKGLSRLPDSRNDEQNIDRV